MEENSLEEVAKTLREAILQKQNSLRSQQKALKPHWTTLVSR